MARDYSTYSIPELQQALGSVDGKRYPENKAALERELQARKDSGEVDRYVRELRDEHRRKQIRGVRIARKVRLVIAAYLVVAPLCAFVGFEIFASSEPAGRLLVAVSVLFLGASFAAGVGLFLNKAWGHWIAVVVLALQIVKVQAAGFVFGLLSLGGVYAYAAADGKVGVAALLDPGLVFESGSDAPVWIGVNFLVLPLIVFLFTAREEIP